MVSGRNQFEGWRCHLFCNNNVYSSALDVGCIKLILAQNSCKGFVAVDVVNYYTSEFDRGRLKFLVHLKMHISKCGVLLML